MLNCFRKQKYVSIFHHYRDGTVNFSPRGRQGPVYHILSYLVNTVVVNGGGDGLSKLHFFQCMG